jgi:hypothetical protein
MKKNLKPGDRIVDEDKDKGIVDEYIYPHSFHPDGFIRYTLDDGRSCHGNASGIKKAK